MIQFQCLWVGEKLYLDNKLTKKTTSRHVQLARYISALITLRYGASRLHNSSPFCENKIGHFSHQVIRWPLENLKDVLYPYNNT